MFNWNLLSCGEGAGYAGGIVSAAMDGERVAEVIALRWNNLLHVAPLQLFWKVAVFWKQSHQPKITTANVAQPPIA